MKKNLLSLTGILAIILAVSSAFTTKSSPKPFANDFEVWSINNGAVNAGVTNYTTVNSQIKSKLYDGGTTAPSGATDPIKLQNAIADYNSSHFPQFSCATNSAKMCVAYLNRGTTNAVLATSDGDSNF
jgi:hypothetical protein